MATFEHVPASQYNLVLKERAWFYLINDEYPHGQLFHAPKPASISFEPSAVKKPAFPLITQKTIETLQPAVFFVHFDCTKNCRSQGICVHYQFVIGSKRCPDGLICERCKYSVDQQV
jgi:hypothetical protein